MGTNLTHKNSAIDLGERKVSVMNFSRVVTLPKPFINNYLKKTRTVRMTMSADGSLTLTPVAENTADGSNEMSEVSA